ncbi:hypothetical protein SEUCBS139899_004420 [Sporothrix eucalyptigena]
MPATAPRPQRNAASRSRDTPALPLQTTTTKCARPPAADSSTLANSPLHRPTSDVIVVSDGPQRFPPESSYTAAEAPAAPTTPAGHNTAPTTPATQTRVPGTRNIPPTAATLTAIPEDVARICGIPDSHADALAFGFSFLYEKDRRLADATFLLQHGVIINYHLYHAIPFKQDTRSQICHRYQTWDHQARGCRKPSPRLCVLRRRPRKPLLR